MPVNHSKRASIAFDSATQHRIKRVEHLGYAYLVACVMLIAVWGPDFVNAVLKLLGQMPVTRTVQRSPLFTYCHMIVDVIVSVGIPWLVVGSHGLGLDRKSRSRWTIWSWVLTILCTFVAMLVSSHILSFLAYQTSVPGPVQGAGQFIPLSVFTAGLHEEPVIVAVIGALLIAKRPVYEILCFVAFVRVLFHAQYALAGVIPITLWATVFVLMWLKYRNLPALVIGHTSYDVFGMVMSS